MKSPLPRQWHDSPIMAALATALPTGTTTLRAMGAALGFAPARAIDRAWFVADKLRAAGALTNPGYGRWQITEKGRLACALLAFQAQRAARRQLARLETANEGSPQ